jgi:hypothetical protein
MKHINPSLLIDVFSRSRILPYLDSCENLQMAIEKYQANIILSEAMIPTLNYLEICLRNRVNQAIQKYYCQDWLLNIPPKLLISSQDQKKIVEIKARILRKSKRELSHDDILAQMTFGFWCSFFHRKYDPLLWHKKEAMKILFPNLARAIRRRIYIEQRILKIKEIRNRIAHQEPIWNNKLSVETVHSMCHELIGAMSTDALEMLKEIDRFPRVYKELNLQKYNI